MTSLMPALRAEILKLSSLTATWVYLALMLIVVPVPVLIMCVFFEPPFGYSWEELLIGVSMFGLIAVIFIGASTAGEVENGMNAHSFLSQKNRAVWLIARLVVGLGVILGMLGVGILLALLAQVALSQQGLDLSDPTSLIYNGMSVILMAICAISLAVATRSKVVAIAIPILAFQVFEPLLKVLAGLHDNLTGLWWFLPLERVQQIATVVSHPSVAETPTGWHFGSLQPMWFNIAVVLGWTVLLLVIGFWANDRRDIR